MFRIKICGITNVEDAISAVDAGADAIGLNFYEKSPRCVRLPDARIISDSATGGTLSYGVFVNHSIDDVARIREQANLDGLQFHGDESAELVAHWCQTFHDRMWGEFPRSLVIRARRLDARGLQAISEDLETCRAAGGCPTAILIDSAIPGHYGGSGQTLSWSGVVDYQRWLGDVPLILAGGLTPDNVAEAIRIVRPAAVDVASGVESSPGKKDLSKVRDFVAAAQAAFESLES
ncbi:MAG: phosphoribosylanthranilate isomerase [Planctomycetaceae bacterium]|nr:phosphoribosylanthranilate isomerase [Planctomycetaceae bacterium]